MAKKAKKIDTANGSGFERVNPNAAGIDISNTEMQVCVPKDRDENNNRTFGVYTQDLRDIAEWLIECGIDTVAMESTGVYWLGIYKILQEYKIDVVLSDAASVKFYRERKTDVSDAEWLQHLHAHGLVKPCHQLENASREVRNLYRHRKSLVDRSTLASNHIHKALTQMNIKLGVAIRDLHGKTGTAILEAILAGERNPQKLAALANPRCKKSKEEIAKSLDGDWNDSLLYIVRDEYEDHKRTQERIAECDRQIEILLTEMLAKSNKVADESELDRSKKKQSNTTAKVTFDIERLCYLLWGVNPMRIPGFSTGTILGLLSELVPHFILQFETCEQFCSWCRLVPNTRISGGKPLSSHLPNRFNQVGQIFRNAAAALYASKEHLGNYYRRIKAKSGPAKAHVATAHKLAKIFYKMLKDKVEYDPNKVGPSEHEILVYQYHKELQKIESLKQRILKISAA